MELYEIAGVVLEFEDTDTETLDESVVFELNVFEYDSAIEGEAINDAD